MRVSCFHILLGALLFHVSVTFAADASRGQKLYRKCIQCHGRSGEGKKAQKAPKLSGQFDWYIVKQLDYMKEGKRINKAMNPYLEPLEHGDFVDLAAYIKTLK
jgi:cytochrome c553